MSDLKRTPLYEQHLVAGAKMVDFGGWDMPLHYGSQLDEHHKVRRDAGMFDVSHMRPVEIQGAQATAFLGRLIANDISKLKLAGKALYSCMLNEAGGVIDDLIVYFLTPNHYRMVVNAGTADKDIAWMQSVARGERFDVTITPRHDVAMIAIQGPQARAKAWTALPHLKAASEPLGAFFGADAGHTFIARTGYTGEDGFEIIFPAQEGAHAWQALVAAGVSPCGLGARDTLRLEAGMNLYGNDMDENTSPLEAGLTWTVDLKRPRNFIGRAAIEATTPAFAMHGLLLEGKGVLRGHQKVATPHGAGEITSGTFSPTLQRSIAFARLPIAVQIGDIVQADVRGQLLPCGVVKMPFVRNGQTLISL